MKKKTSVLAILCFWGGCALCSEPVTHFSFEETEKIWNIHEGDVQICSSEAHNGKRSLKIIDPDSSQRVSVSTPPISLNGMKYFVISGWIKIEKGLGGKIRVYLLDKNKNKIGIAGGQSFSSKRKDVNWDDFQFRCFVDNPAAQYFTFDFKTNANEKLIAYLDDLTVKPQSEQSARALPWEPQYRLTPKQKDKLTEADIPGPDGIVYPNWKHTGTQADTTGHRPVFQFSNFGGMPNDGIDDAQALEKACRKVGEKGGGVIQLDEGTYYLDHPVWINQNNIIIRGAGRDTTRLEIRYHPERGLSFFRLEEGQTIGPETIIALHADLTGMLGFKIFLDDELLRTWERPKRHNGNRSYNYTTCEKIKGKIADGKHNLRAVAYFTDGSSFWERWITLPINYSSTCTDKNDEAHSTTVIDFVGKGFDSEEFLLAKDGLRGSRELILQKRPSLKPGDVVMIRSPETKRWNSLTRNSCKWGIFRAYIAVVETCDKNTISLVQPLRINFPIIDGSFIIKMNPISNCGIESLSIEQIQNYWVNTIGFRYAINCWVKEIDVTMSGRKPLNCTYAKWLTISDCVLRDSWHKGGGGSAYVGWEVSYDCLMENVETFAMRHAPLFQWSASGCVIRNSTFHNSDAHWHSGWTSENLIENCVITSTKGNGGYGFGMWVSPPEDSAHGPNGPRNVIYNCDCSSPKDGIRIGGMNENWLVLYNRYRVEKGAGLFTKNASFHHIVKGNIFVLANPNSAMTVFKTPDCSGAWIENNILYGGNGKFVEGLGKSAIEKGNQTLPYAPDPSRPSPKVPSIYQWQQKHR